MIEPIVFNLSFYSMPRSPALPIIVGNWKMYKTIKESVAYLHEFIPSIRDASAQVSLAVPFTAIKPLVELCKGTKIRIGAQNMHDAAEGAFTGEIAGRMLEEVGAQFVILGHSERRRFFNETNEFINKKVKQAIQINLPSILCIGETAQERDDHLTEQVLTAQLRGCLAGIKASQMKNMLIAYEPVWAIGTGKVATPEIAQEAHQFCRSLIAAEFTETTAKKIGILYGGSVNIKNAAALLEQSDVNGLLVGSASLEADLFAKIIHLCAPKQ